MGFRSRDVYPAPGKALMMSNSRTDLKKGKTKYIIRNWRFILSLNPSAGEHVGVTFFLGMESDKMIEQHGLMGREPVELEAVPDQLLLFTGGVTIDGEFRLADRSDGQPLQLNFSGK